MCIWTENCVFRPRKIQVSECTRSIFDRFTRTRINAAKHFCPSATRLQLCKTMENEKIKCSISSDARNSHGEHGRCDFEHRTAPNVYA